MPSFSAALAAFATGLMLFTQAKAAPWTPIWRQACQTPIWTVKDLKIAYSSDTYTPGNATFSITSSLTNKTETLRCEVPFNYFGHISGTPENINLSISLQFNIDTATISLNQTWACGNETVNVTR
ncbi:hypothetical protein GQ53DRAFT_763540 [Thozetella sp. PMI_491]|nr:hypothetical protein GQ53DRAFT_763540 [Thozetella sp. PMI_491]